MKTFGSQDMVGVMADYAPDAVMFTPNGPVKGYADREIASLPVQFVRFRRMRSTSPKESR